MRFDAPRSRHTILTSWHQMIRKGFVMNRPHDYDEVRVTVRNLTYQCEDEHFNGMHTTGGVLSKGQVVWIRKSRGLAHIVSAYVEGVGLVTIDPRFLVQRVNRDDETGISHNLPEHQTRPSV